MLVVAMTQEAEKVWVDVVQASNMQQLGSCIVERTSGRKIFWTKAQVLARVFATSGALKVLRASTKLKEQLSAYHDVPDVTIKASVVDVNDVGQRYRLRMVRTATAVGKAATNMAKGCDPQSGCVCVLRSSRLLNSGCTSSLACYPSHERVRVRVGTRCAACWGVN